MLGKHHRTRTKKKGVKTQLQGLYPPISKSNIDKSRKAGKKNTQKFILAEKIM